MCKISYQLVEGFSSSRCLKRLNGSSRHDRLKNGLVKVECGLFDDAKFKPVGKV